MKRKISTLLLLVAAAFGRAQTFVETEPNDTFATANALSSGVPPYSLTGDPTLIANDVDYFRIHLVPNTALSAVAQPLVSDFTPNTILGLFDSTSTHALLRFNDDFGDTAASAFTYRVATEGDYFIGVTGFGKTAANGGFTGTHSQIGGYQLTVSVSPTPVPEPGTFAALGVGAIAFLRRRRRGR